MPEVRKTGFETVSNRPALFLLARIDISRLQLLLRLRHFSVFSVQSNSFPPDRTRYRTRVRR